MELTSCVGLGTLPRWPMIDCPDDYMEQEWKGTVVEGLEDVIEGFRLESWAGESGGSLLRTGLRGTSSLQGLYTAEAEEENGLCGCVPSQNFFVQMLYLHISSTITYIFTCSCSFLFIFFYQS